MILGIDPGIANTGWVLMFPDAKLGHLRVGNCGIIKTKPKTHLYERVWVIAESLRNAIGETHLEGFGFENYLPSRGRGQQGAGYTGYTRGFLDAAIVSALSKPLFVPERKTKPSDVLVTTGHAVPHIVVNPMTVKKWLTGSGKSDKDAMISAAGHECPTLFENHAAGYWEHLADAYAIAHITTCAIAGFVPGKSTTWRNEMLRSIPVTRVSKVVA